MEEIQQRADELKNWSEGDETENPDEATEADYQNALRKMGGRSMTKKELIAAVENAKAETKIAWQTVYDAMNQGQRKKIVKDEAVKSLFDLYGVEYSA